jgi:hypothetical protein
MLLRFIIVFLLLLRPRYVNSRVAYWSCTGDRQDLIVGLSR